eukprot:TRINITY_DN1389_c0_g1_i2.p1 TRINITY_DN1389_c0_g1~~TRINITY_DN1389_c0_g1_i2.p1  ORF type:complete len:130 (+),score=7.76 TRINITY_DN1389_c0_g1_i2:79-468(+)
MEDLIESNLREERFCVASLLTVGVNIILEYYYSFNIIVLFLRTVQLILALRVKQIVHDNSRHIANIRNYPEFIVTLITVLNTPAFFLHLFDHGMQPMFIIFVGKRNLFIHSKSNSLFQRLEERCSTFCA